MSELQMGQNTPVPTSSLRAVLRWTPGPVSVDTSALLLTSSGKVRSDADFVFFNQPSHASGAVRYEGGDAASGRDVVAVDLGAVEGDIERVAVVASADGGTFGQVDGLSLAVEDGSGHQLFTFPMQAGTETAFLLGEFYRRGGEWKFRAVGQGWAAGLAGLATDFGISVDDDGSGSSSTAPPPATQAAPPAASAPPAISLKKQKLVDMEKKVAAKAPRLLDLTKKAAVSLEKRGLGEHTARVALCLDISGSMHRLYKRGSVQRLAERVLALALRFDDDGEVDVFLFGRQAYQSDPITLDNHGGYVENMLRMHKLEAGTRYGQAMELLRQHYTGSSTPRNTPAPQQLPAYVMFVTDGASTDRQLTEEQLVSSSYEPIFWQFMAVGAPGSREFAFLQQLDDLPGRHLDNADFFAVEDPETISDDQLFDLLMTEYPGWLQRARSGGLLPPA